MRFAWILVFAAACSTRAGAGADGGAGSDAAGPSCTPEGQHVTGTTLMVTPVDAMGASSCSSRLLTSSADVAAAFPGSTPPADLASVDFSVDRVVLAASNPAVEFAVDDGTTLVVGEQGFCQGVAPYCVGYIVHNTVRSTLQVASCPYVGPMPCNAP